MNSEIGHVKKPLEMTLVQSKVKLWKYAEVLLIFKDTEMAGPILEPLSQDDNHAAHAWLGKREGKKAKT